jgi:phage baseplate assembly protein W
MANETLKISRLYKDLDLSFEPNPVTGDVSKKVDVNAVKQSMRILMLTNFYERPFAPKKAANLRGILFENISSLRAASLETIILNLFENYEPRVKIQKIQVNANYDNNRYDVNITFYVVGIDAPQILSANLKRLR